MEFIILLLKCVVITWWTIILRIFPCLGINIRTLFNFYPLGPLSFVNSAGSREGRAGRKGCSFKISAAGFGQ